MRSRVAAERAEFAAPPTSADASSVLVVMDTIILDHPKLLGTGDIRHDRRRTLPLSQSLDLTLVQSTDLNHYSFFLRWSRSEEHTYELQSLMRTSHDVF